MRRLKPMFAPALEAEEVAPVVDIQAEENPLLEIEASEEAGDITEAAMGDVEADYEANENALDESMEVSAVLESLTELVTQAKANGTFNETSSRITHATLDYISKRAGVKTTLTPSLESFNDVGQRTASAVLVLEGLKEAANKVWEFIVNAIMKSIEFVKKLFQKIFTNTAKTQKQCDDLAKDLKEFTEKQESGAAPKQYHSIATSFDNQGLAQTLAIDTRVPKDIASVLRAYVEISQHTFDAKVDFGQDHLFDMLDSIAGKKRYQWSDYKVGNHHVPGTKPFKSHSVSANEGDDFTMLSLSTDTTFGNGRVEYTIPPPGLRGQLALNAVAKSSIFVQNAPTGYNQKFAPIPLMTISDCEHVIGEVHKVNQMIIGFKDRADENEDFKHKLGAACGNIKKAMDQSIQNPHNNPSIGNIVEFPGGNASELLSFLHALIRVIDQPGFNYIRYAVKINDALLSYVDQCMHLRREETQASA